MMEAADTAQKARHIARPARSRRRLGRGEPAGNCEA